MFEHLILWLEIGAGIATAIALVLMLALYLWTPRGDLNESERKRVRR